MRRTLTLLLVLRQPATRSHGAPSGPTSTAWRNDAINVEVVRRMNQAYNSNSENVLQIGSIQALDGLPKAGPKP